MQLLKPVDQNKKVAQTADDYCRFYDNKKADEDLETERVADSANLASSYYDMATDFFEYGWGESFHFCTLDKGDSMEHAIAKHEYRLALKLGLRPGDTVLVCR